MKTLLTTTILAFALFSAKAQTFNPNLAQKLQDTLDYLVSTNMNTKGISASVYYPGQGIWKGASGISNVGVPMTTEMVIPLASNSKLYTAVMMLMLAENNIIGLDDPLDDWLPNYPNINPNTTVRQLLNHTSGISDMYITQQQFDTILNYPNQIWTGSGVLGIVGAPQFAPGGGFYYSNTNYILAGMVAESATGISFPQLIRDSILSPLLLDSTFFTPIETVTGSIAVTWKNGVVNSIPVSLLSAVGPAGSIVATAGEVVQWYHALMSGQIINANSIAEMTNFLLPGNYGMGIQKYSFNGRTVWGHGGINPEGSRTRTIYDPCSEAVVCGLSNSNNSGIDGVTVLLHKVLVDYLPACPGAVTGITTVCQGQTAVTYTVPLITNATSYIWTLPNGATGVSSTNTITVDYGVSAISGNVSVVGSNSYGESPVTSLFINVDPIPTTPVISIVGEVLTSNAPSGNQWYDSNGPIVGATNATYTITANDTYYCIVTLLGCSSDPSNVILGELINLDETYLENSLKMYPNPANSVINIEVTNFSGQLVVFNPLGQQLETVNLSPQENSVQFELSDWSRGIYFVQLVNADGQIVAVKKVIVE